MLETSRARGNLWFSRGVLVLVRFSSLFSSDQRVPGHGDSRLVQYIDSAGGGSKAADAWCRRGDIFGRDGRVQDVRESIRFVSSKKAMLIYSLGNMTRKPCISHSYVSTDIAQYD